MMENNTPRLKVNNVTWELPMEGWIKVNTDDASRKNPDRSAIGYCLRDELGDVRYAFGKEINEVTNTELEAIAILEAIRFCVQYH